MAKTKIVKLKYNNIKAKLNNCGMKKVINKSNKCKVQPNKENWSSLRKALNELDPNFDSYIRKITKPPTLKMKDLKTQLKKAKEEEDKEKKKSSK